LHRVPPPCAKHLSFLPRANLMHPGSLHFLCFILRNIIHNSHFISIFNRNKLKYHQKVAPPPLAAHAPTGRIIIMSASHSFHIFHKLELIKREKFINDILI
jgi:hypothetical protein